MLVVDLALTLGALLAVPAGVALHPLAPVWSRRTAPLVAVPAGAAVWLPQGPLATVLVVPLALCAGAWGLASLLRWWSGSRRVLQLADPAAFAYLGVGTVWLAADRLALEPAGFAPPFVQLTAVHFIYAGFASTLLASLTRRRLGGRAPRSTAAAVVLIVAGPPLVALGFTALDVLLTVGAVVLMAGLYLVAGLWWFVLAPTVGSMPRWALRVAALAVLAGMVLAVHWAAGATFGFRSLSIPTMASTHGVLNAVGFVGFGLAAWWRLLSAPGQPRPGRPRSGRPQSGRGRADAARTDRPRRGTV